VVDLIDIRGAESRLTDGARMGEEAPLVFDPVEAYHSLRHERELALDIETGGLNPWRDPVAVVSLHGRETGIMSVLHVRGEVPPPIVELLSKSGTVVTGHNINTFDLPFLHVAGCKVMNLRPRDTLVQELCCIQAARRDTRVNLFTSTKRRIGVELKKDIDHRTWMQPTLTPEQLAYAAGDVRHMFRLSDAQWEEVRGTDRARAIETEHMLAPALIRMTLNGLPFSERAWRLYYEAQYTARDKAEDDLVQAFGPINLRSASQVKRALADYGVVVKDTKHDTLVEISEMGGDSGRVVDVLLNFKKPDQRLKMYSPEWVKRYVTGGMVHPRVWQVGTDTGRMSNSDPNLQQVAKDDARKMFEAWEGWKIVSADYSQIEVFTAAYYARDAAMFEALSSADTHTTVASMIFGCPPGDVTPAMRKLAKAATFTLLFGGGAGRLYDYARHNGSSIDEAQARSIVAAFFNKFQGLKEMRSKAYHRAANSRSVPIDLPTGLRRVLAGPTLSGPTILNTLVQGTAAAGLKYALIEAHRRGLTKYIGATVHDEIVSHVPDAEVDDFRNEIEECMLQGMATVLPGVPIKVGLEHDQTWGGGLLLRREAA
jgi:DNA polymerase I-like protein with 3'-5' exonuclease and polymerase domains